MLDLKLNWAEVDETDTLLNDSATELLNLERKKSKMWNANQS